MERDNKDGISKRMFFNMSYTPYSQLAPALTAIETTPAGEKFFTMWASTQIGKATSFKKKCLWVRLPPGLPQIYQ